MCSNYHILVYQAGKCQQSSSFPLHSLVHPGISSSWNSARRFTVSLPLSANPPCSPKCATLYSRVLLNPSKVTKSTSVCKNPNTDWNVVKCLKQFVFSNHHMNVSSYVNLVIIIFRSLIINNVYRCIK